MTPEERPSRWSRIGKTATISAVVLLISLGLCGIAIKINNGSVLGVGILGALGCIVGTIGLLGAGITALITLLFSSDTPKDKP